MLGLNSCTLFSGFQKLDIPYVKQKYNIITNSVRQNIKVLLKTSTEQGG